MRIKVNKLLRSPFRKMAPGKKTRWGRHPHRSHAFEFNPGGWIPDFTPAVGWTAVSAKKNAIVPGPGGAFTGQFG
uniref:Uncharacterized protein n=1 Tax=Magnetospirillum gryphiswaldense TaxID=55518 RepID=A4TTQ1_9PROT|nr:hypothetical protein MGR_2088 [Magnetospirillum gryphiswaldense MSR-1]